MVACVAVFAVVLGGGLLGAQATGAVVRLQDGGAWLANLAQGSVTWVNGYAGQAGKTVPVGSLSSPFTVVQRADGAYAVDADGNATLIDGAQLKASDAPGQLASGVDVVASDAATWLIDTTRGQVRRLDPDTLQPTGDPIALKGVTKAVVDDEGYLWAAVPADGTVIRVGETGSGPTEVGRPGENLTVAADESGEHVVAVNATAGSTFSLHGDDPARSFPALPGDATLTVDVDHDGRLLIGQGKQAVVVPADGEGRAVTLPSGTKVSQVDIVAGVGYVTDRDAGSLVRVDLGSAAGTAVPNVGGDELTDVEAHGNLLYLNDSGGNQVKVVRPDGVIVPIEKYRPGKNRSQQSDPIATSQPATSSSPDRPKKQTRTPENTEDPQAEGTPTRQPRRNQGVPAKDDTPEPEATESPTPTKTPDEPGAPGAPTVTATADDGQALLEWKAPATHGSPITGYEVLIGNEAAQEVGATELSYTVAGLTNGQRYGVRVRALSDAGKGDLSRIEYVTPSADLPGVPPNVAAVAGDGRIKVTWGAAEGGRTAVQDYEITVTAVGGGATTAESGGTQATVTGLTNGTRYTVEVAARSAGGTGEAGVPAAGAEGSDDNPAVPSGQPGKVTFGTTTNGDKQATVTWGAADAAGSDITGYEVKVGSGTATNIGVKLTYTATGLANDTGSTVAVRAVNENGSGDWASTTVKPVTPRRAIYQCKSKEVSDIYMLNLDNDCNNAVASRWNTGTEVFQAPKTEQTGTKQYMRCETTEDRGIIRKQAQSCTGDWDANKGTAFWAWPSSHTGATQIVEWHYPNGGYYYAKAGTSAPSGFTKTGTSFWV